MKTSKQIFNTSTSVRTMAKQLILKKEAAQKQKVRDEEAKRLLARKVEENKKGKELIGLFENRFFSDQSSNRKVAKIVANMQDYYILTRIPELVGYAYNSIFQAHIAKLAKKFDISIQAYRVKPDDYWSGSGDDMVYYRNPAELRVTFKL